MHGAFALECCDREAMGHLATTGSITAEDIRELMVATVEPLRSGETTGRTDRVTHRQWQPLRRW